MKKREIIVVNIESGEEVEKIDVTGWLELDVVNKVNEVGEKHGSSEIDIEIKESEGVITKDGFLALPVQFNRFTVLKDKSYNITFNTMPPSDEKILTINRLYQDVGVMLFKTTESLKEEDFEILDSVEEKWEKSKTQSERLYNVLYRCWEQKPEGFKKWKDYYKFKTDQLIDHFKAKLNPIGV